jgi:hypothetical protein
VRLGHDAIEERQVIAEREHARRSVTFASLPSPREQRLGHRRHVLVAEAHVGAHEERVAGLHGRHAELARLGVGDRRARDDLLARASSGARPW